MYMILEWFLHCYMLESDMLHSGIADWQNQVYITDVATSYAYIHNVLQPPGRILGCLYISLQIYMLCEINRFSCHIFFYAHIYRGILACNFLVPPLVGFSLYAGSPCIPQPSTITVDYTIGFIKHEPLDFGWAFIVWIPCMFSQNLNIYIYIPTYPNLSQPTPLFEAGPPCPSLRIGSFLGDLCH